MWASRKGFGRRGAVSNASSLDNFHENLPFSVSYEDLSLAQSFSATALNNVQQSIQEASHSHTEDHVTYKALSTSYAAFPIVQAVHDDTHQLHQSTKHVIEKSSSIGPGEYTKQREFPESSTSDQPTPVRVTRPPNAFLLFNKELRKQLKESNPTMKVAEISKEIGSRWKSLNATEKNRYIEEANAIKEAQRALHPNAMYMRRSKAELIKAGHYIRRKRSDGSQEHQQSSPPPNHGSLSGGLQPPIVQTGRQTQRKRQRRSKNSAAPKHPLSAYMWYLSDVRPETMQTYPGSTVGQISKLCAERWNTMTESERMPWHTKAQADKARYAREMQIYAAQLDYPMGRGTRQKYKTAAASTSSPLPTSSSPLPQLLVASPSAVSHVAKGYCEQQSIQNNPLQHQHFQSPQEDLQQPHQQFSMAGTTTSILNVSMTATVAVPDTMGSSPLLHSQSADMN